MRRWLIGLCLLSLIGGCQKAAPTVKLSEGRRSPAGFEIRYNAAVALARMGSDHAKERLDVLTEMLDEEQQLRNFRTTIVDGKEVQENQARPDPVAARTAVESALKAIVELHRKKPALDLSSLMPAIEKLGASPNPALRLEAERTRLALAPPSQ